VIAAILQSKDRQLGIAQLPYRIIDHVVGHADPCIVASFAAQLTALAIRDDFDDDLWRFAKLPKRNRPMACSNMLSGIDTSRLIKTSAHQVVDGAKEDADVCRSPKWTGTIRLSLGGGVHELYSGSVKRRCCFSENVVHWLVILRHQCVDSCELYRQACRSGGCDIAGSSYRQTCGCSNYRWLVQAVLLVVQAISARLHTLLPTLCM
jgi:hypothetical protein